jgi:hypothetical protein
LRETFQLTLRPELCALRQVLATKTPKHKSSQKNYLLLQPTAAFDVQ